MKIFKPSDSPGTWGTSPHWYIVLEAKPCRHVVCGSCNREPGTSKCFARDVPSSIKESINIKEYHKNIKEYEKMSKGLLHVFQESATSEWCLACFCDCLCNCHRLPGLLKGYMAQLNYPSADTKAETRAVAEATILIGNKPLDIRARSEHQTEFELI